VTQLKNTQYKVHSNSLFMS